MAKLAIIVDGGIVQSVLTDDAANYPLDVTIVDYDTDGAADSELTLVDQGDGTFQTAIVRKETVELADAFFERLEPELFGTDADGQPTIILGEREGRG